MAEEEDCSWIDMDPVAGDMKRRKKRFSEEQVKSLESMFESQAKLDPSKKLQLAGELGLQPRQVAIWFQNKRARWKSKQLEREYRVLKASYGDLRSSFESLKKEKQVLTKQLQMLRETLDERPEKRMKTGGYTNGGDVDHHQVAIQQPVMNIEKEEGTCIRQAVGGLANAAAAAEQQLGFLHTWPSDHQLFNSMQWWDFWPVNE